MARGYRSVTVSEGAIEIREFRHSDLETVVEFSLRAWAPVFASVRDVMGDDIFLRLTRTGKWIGSRLLDRAVRMMTVTSS